MTIFLHSGKIGDCIYSLPTVRALGGGMVFLEPRFFTRHAAEALVPLLLKQRIVHHCRVGTPSKVDVDLNRFRGEDYRKYNLSDCHLRAFGLAASEPDTAWLHVDGMVEEVNGRVVFARAQRAFGYEDFWKTAFELFGSRAFFVGTEVEHHAFTKRVGFVPWYPTEDMLEVALVINSSLLFIGNQSAPHAIAEGLNKAVVVEVGRREVFPEFPRRNAFYIREHRDWERAVRCLL